MSESFARIGEKVRAGERLSEGDGLTLFLEPDVLAVGQLANEVRERRHGDLTYFNRNMRIEVTNVCVASCLFCSFAKLEEHMPGAHTMKLEAQGLSAERERRQLERLADELLAGSPRRLWE